MFSHSYTQQRKNNILFNIKNTLTRKTDKLSYLREQLNKYTDIATWLDENNFTLLIYVSSERNSSLKLKLFYLLLEEGGANPNTLRTYNNGEGCSLTSLLFDEGITYPSIARFLVSYGINFQIENYPESFQDEVNNSRLFQACHFVSQVENIDNCRQLFEKINEAENQEEIGDYTSATSLYIEALDLIDQIIAFEKKNPGEDVELSNTINQIMQERRQNIFSKKLHCDTLAANRRSLP